MPFKIADHGGRFLYVNDENQIQTHTDYNLSLNPEELAAKGSVFDVDDADPRQLVSDSGPVQFKPERAGRPCNLLIDQISPQEYVIRADHRRKSHRYVYSKLESLDLQDDPGPMAMFSIVEIQQEQQPQQQDGHQEQQQQQQEEQPDYYQPPYYYYQPPQQQQQQEPQYFYYEGQRLQ